jgi:outer membrane protein, multidrug efflux system
MRTRELLLASAATVLLTACAVGPDHSPPPLEAPEAFQRGEPGLYPPTPVEAGFWEQFQDPLLQALVQEAMTVNHDLRIGLARYDRSRALLGEARWEQLPSVTAGASAAHQRLSADQMPGATRNQRQGESYETGLSAAWELDFLGRVRRGVQAQRADSEAYAADLDALRRLVLAELVDSYFQLRGLQEQLRVSTANADNQRESLALVEARLQAGRGTELDRIRARAQLAATLARIPLLEGEIAATTHRIAVLVGRQPDELVRRLEEPQPLPALPTTVATGLPGELLRRRPDVIAAERRLEAATARIGIATADLYPRFTLGGFIGTQAGTTGALFSRDSETRLIALGVDWSFLDRGRVRARMAAADADADASLAAYQQAILLALEETETAMARYRAARREHAQLGQAARDSADAARLARLRYEGGVIDFLEVIDAERTRLDNESSLAASHTRSARALVALYRALAGGWPAEFHGPDMTARFE